MFLYDMPCTFLLHTMYELYITDFTKWTKGNDAQNVQNYKFTIKWKLQGVFDECLFPLHHCQWKFYYCLWMYWIVSLNTKIVINASGADFIRVNAREFPTI